MQDLRVVDTAGLTRFPLIGLCQGGAIAAAFAARYPERVSHLILYDSYGKGALTDDTPPQMREEAEALNIRHKEQHDGVLLSAIPPTKSR